MSTPEEKLAAIAAILGDTAPVAANDPSAWLRPAGMPPTVPLTELSNEGELKRYAVWGFKMDLTRGVDPNDFPKMLGLAVDVMRAGTQDAAEGVVGRASLFPPEVAAYGLLTGCTQGFSAFSTPKLTFPPNIQSIAQAAAYAAFKPIPDAPGPGL